MERRCTRKRVAEKNLDSTLLSSWDISYQPAHKIWCWNFLPHSHSSTQTISCLFYLCAEPSSCLRLVPVVVKILKGHISQEAFLSTPPYSLPSKIDIDTSVECYFNALCFICHCSLPWLSYPIPSMLKTRDLAYLGSVPILSSTVLGTKKGLGQHS